MLLARRMGASVQVTAYDLSASQGHEFEVVFRNGRSVRIVTCTAEGQAIIWNEGDPETGAVRAILEAAAGAHATVKAHLSGYDPERLAA